MHSYCKVYRLYWATQNYWEFLVKKGKKIPQRKRNRSNKMFHISVTGKVNTWMRYQENKIWTDADLVVIHALHDVNKLICNRQPSFLPKTHIHTPHFRFYCYASCGILMSKVRNAYKHISETVFIVQEHSISTVLTHYEIDTSWMCCILIWKWWKYLTPL